MKPITTSLTESRPSLQEAQKFVGGYVELLQYDDCQLLVNEHGVLNDLPLNEAVSTLCGQNIYGNVMILKDKALWTTGESE